jgi:GMP synthase-like glutamine amidotransferase
MKLHFLQHHPEEGLGTIETWAYQNSFKISVSKLYKNETNFPSDFDFLVIMGGPQSVYEDTKFSWLKDEKLFIQKTVNRGVPILGICLGAQLLADVLGAKVYPNIEKEIGWFPVWFSEVVKTKYPQIQFPHSLDVFHWHGDTFDLPENSIPVGWSEATKNQGFIYNNKVIALQFHPEIDEKSIQNMSYAFKKELNQNGKYIQKEKEILEDKNRFILSKNLIFRILDYLLKG